VAPVANVIRALLIPQALGARVLVVFALLPELLVEPAAAILARGDAERAVHFPVIACDELFDLLFAFDEDRQRRRLYAAHGRLVEAAALGIERGHRASAVDADQPVRLRAARR